MVHIKKLTVGCNSLQQFIEWQHHHRTTYNGHHVNFVLTRFAPKRAEEILEARGSIYRIINGRMGCRQRILGFDSVDTVNGKKCLILTDTEIIRTYPVIQNAFQGWRYLKEEDTPEDISIDSNPNHSIEIEIELKRLGLL